MTAPFPPLVPPWDGDPAFIVDEARKQLVMKLSDPGIATLERLVGSAIDVCRNYLGWSSVPDAGATTVPDPVRDSMIAVLTEMYRRRELSFGVLGTADPDGVAYRITPDWIASNLPNIRIYKVSYGLA